ncbi:MAG: hypothetical protein KAQ62_24110, partial [Cyclobacteriaceae bacterium]|nr:hypothetical protein [Cyclobacteriaceae bacterium]
DPRTELITHFTDAINYDNTINYNIITSIYKDKNDELWLGTEGRGINIYNSEKGEFTYIRQNSNETSLVHENIKEILGDKKGRKFIATVNGLSIYNPLDDSFFNITKNPAERGYINSNTVHDLCGDKYGNVWLGTTGTFGRFQMYDIGRDTIFHFLMDDQESEKLINIDINVQFYDETNNILWAGGDDGLCAFNVENKSYLVESKYLELVEAFRGIIITDLHMNNQDLLWVGTLGRGLYIVDINSYELRKVTQEDGFYDYSIYSLISDSLGNIWAAANEYLLKISNISHIHEKIGSIEKLGIQEGFPPQQYYRKSVHKDAEGYLYFGGDNGFIKFNPIDIYNIIIHPSVILTNIMVNGNPLIEETHL